MSEQIKSTADFIRDKINFQPETGIILGTGLGGLVNEIEITQCLNYDTIPNFPVSTVEGHKGRLIFGMLNGRKVIAMQGRFHFYEGYTPQQITFPVRVMKFLGIKNLIVSNASGGVNPDFEIGDLMIINDHINLIPNPLIGKNLAELGPRFPDMSKSYDKSVISAALSIAEKNNIKVRLGVYCAVTGPTFETPAEYQYFRHIGADAVGMSTAPEVVVARHMGVPVFAISIITDLGVPGKIVEVSHEEVQRVAEQAEQRMTKLIKELVRTL